MALNESEICGVVYQRDEKPTVIEMTSVFRILQTLQHPCIMTPILDTREEDSEKPSVLCSPTTLLTLLEQSASGTLPEDRAHHYLMQIVSALEYIHDHGIVHKNVKLENVLVDEATDRCFLTGFDLARQYDGVNFLQDRVGSLHYSAPEIWKCSPYRGPEVDVWSLGVTLYLMVTGVFPFGGTTPAEVEAEMEKYLDVWFPSHFDDDLQDLISKMLLRSRHCRITLPEIRYHPWTAKGVERFYARMSLAHQNEKKKSKTRKKSSTPVQRVGFRQEAGLSSERRHSKEAPNEKKNKRKKSRKKRVKSAQPDQN